MGVMLYPGQDESDRRRAAAWAAQYLVGPLRELHEQGGSITYDDLLRIATTEAAPLQDVDQRAMRGRATGEMFKVFIALAGAHPKLASWNNAARIVQHVAKQKGAPCGRSLLWHAKSEFASVAHLWAAWSIRERFAPDPSEDIELIDDFLTYLTESEVLREWGQTWKAPRANSLPPLPDDVWRLAPDWNPPRPIRKRARLGDVPLLTVSDELLGLLRSAGQRKK
jgi:hypothetical protein